MRRRVTERGIVSFVCAPLWGPQGPLGSLSLAWRDRAAPIERGAQLLSIAGGPIATTVRAALLGAREAIGRACDAANAGREARGRACLHAMVDASHARAGTVALYDPDGGDTMVLSTSSTAGICANAADGRLRCARLARGHGVLLEGPRGEWPAACRCLPENTLAPLCLPLRSGGRLHGILVLDRGDAPPSPSGRDLVLLLTMASEAAVRLAPQPRERSSPRVTGISADAVLELRCLGGFDVRLHQRTIPPEAFIRKKALALLKTLVLSAGNPVNRDALADRLWPGVHPRTGANRLHGVLHALRTAIEPFSAQRRWIYVCNMGDLYYFNMESPHWIDIYEFRRHSAGAYEAERRGRLDDAIRHVESALALYRGDLFADDPYSSWCELERAELRHRYVDLTARAAALWGAAGQVDRGVGWLRRGLSTDPLREDLHQALIRSLVTLGRRHEARVQYEACVRVLRDELHAEPLPETRQLERLTLDPATIPFSPFPSSSL